MIFYNLAEFAFEHLRDSRRILAPLLFSFPNWFAQHDRTVTSILLALLLPSCSHWVFFFWHNKLVGGFFVRPKSHNLCTETKCLKLSPEGFCEIPPQKQSWGRQPPMNDKGKIGLGQEKTSAWWDYFVNEVVLPEHLFHTCTMPGPTRFYHFELFSVDRRNQLENYNSSVDEIN